MTRSPVDAAFRTEWPTLVATLVREVRDLDLAEESVQDAFAEAATRWRRDGPPARPGAWLLTTARRRAIDRIRRRRRLADRLPLLAASIDAVPDPRQLADDQMALLFGCCHPALALDAQVALTLRAVGGLTTAQIARAFLVRDETMAKRLVRAKHKIRAAGVPFAVPPPERLEARVAAVSAVIYAIFTEGHASSTGPTLVRGDLCDEAIWLAESLATLVPHEPETHGLAALLLLTDARRAARVDDAGRPVLLADQDRSRWDRAAIDRGLRHLGRAHAGARLGPYQAQAAIAALHATAPAVGETDWPAIVRLYDLLVAWDATPVVRLNRAAAIAEVDGPAVALSLLDELADAGALRDYHYLDAARATMLERLGRHADAVAALRRAAGVCDNEAERRWLEHRITTLARP